MSRALLVPMLMLRSPRLWEQHQVLLLSSTESRMTLEAIEALTGFDLGGSDQREIAERLSVLLAHLLKWEFQPNGRTDRWRAMIHTQRMRIAMLIIRRPRLARYVTRILRERYGAARGVAVVDTGLNGTSFPEDCPYSPRQALDSDYLPAAA